MNRFDSLFRPGISPIVEDKYISYLPSKGAPTQQPGNSKVNTGITPVGNQISIPISGSMTTLPLINLPVIGNTPNPASSLPAVKLPDQEQPSGVGYVPYLLAGGLALYWYMNR